MTEEVSPVVRAAIEFEVENPFTLAGFNHHEVELILSAYRRAFLAGAEWQRERDAEICNEITLANWITFAGEPPEQSEWLSEKCAVAIRKQSKEEK